MHVRPAEEELIDPPFGGMKIPSYDNIDRSDFYYIKIEESDGTNYYLGKVTSKDRLGLRVKLLVAWVTDVWLPLNTTHTVTVPRGQIGEQITFYEPMNGGRRAQKTRRARKEKRTRKAKRTRK
jgi:hypothetical protein